MQLPTSRCPKTQTATRIPLRLPVGTVPSVAPEDVVLEDGDIVMVSPRDNDFFYTGVLLPGGQWPLPRDTISTCLEPWH